MISKIPKKSGYFLWVFTHKNRGFYGKTPIFGFLAIFVWFFHTVIPKTPKRGERRQRPGSLGPVNRPPLRRPKFDYISEFWAARWSFTAPWDDVSYVAWLAGLPARPKIR